MAISLSQWFKFKLPAFNDPLYHVALNANFNAIDVLLHRYIAVNNFEGIWENSTAYTAGQTVADISTGLVYVCLVNHVSAADPTTFAQDRTAHPTYWEEYNSSAVDYASQAAESADDAAASAAAALISEVNAAASAAAAATSGGDLRAVNNLSELTDKAVARANLQLLGMAQQNPAAVAITGGSVTGITDLAVADGGTGASTAAGAFNNIKQQATEDSSGVGELATTAEIAAATADKLIEAQDLNTASARVSLSDAATIAVDWTAAAANYVVTVTANRIIGNPTNEIVGQWRTILVKGNDATDRTITFDTEFLGEVPTITDCDSTRWYLITIHCVEASHFSASAKKVKGT